MTAKSIPNPQEIRAARQSAGLSQTQAGALVGVALRTWQQWEAGDCRMRAALWELFQIRTGAGPDCNRESDVG